MDALKALHERVSVPRLVAPAPTAEQQQALFAAALRAPDHGYLRPWRFLVIEADGLLQLGELFAQAALSADAGLTQEALARYRGMPMRAPMLIVAISRSVEHAKVPAAEQDMACAVAVGNMLVAAHAMGLGAVWRTGDMAYAEGVRQGLGLADNERIIAFLYLGHPAGELKRPPMLDQRDFFQRWPEV